MKEKIKKNNKGFVILFAVTISAVLLAIALGVSNIAFKEVKFSTSARDTNDAFFAADTGIECALFYDKPPSYFPITGPATSITCASNTVIPTFSGTPNVDVLYSFFITGLGNTNASCVKVSVSKIKSGSNILTTAIAKGYNIGDASCNSTNLDRIEREIKTTY